MSSIYQPKRKELAKVKIMSSAEYNANRKNLKFVGGVRRGYTAFITTKENRKNKQVGFIDDTVSLTKRAKNDLVKFFSNKENRGKSVAYLVVEKENKKRQIKGGVKK